MEIKTKWFINESSMGWVFDRVKGDNVFSYEGESVILCTDELEDIFTKEPRFNAFNIADVFKKLDTDDIALQIWITPTFDSNKLLNSLEISELIDSGNANKLIGRYVSSEDLYALKEKPKTSYFFKTGMNLYNIKGLIRYDDNI